MTFSKVFVSLIFICPIVTILISCQKLTWDSPNNYLYPAHKLANLLKLPKDKRPTGKGIKVGIVDSGIDFTHPALGGCFGKECRVQYGKAIATSVDFLPTHLKGTPYDNFGHGTGIAGIIGGKDENILGVAPDVIFGAYKANNYTDILDSRVAILAGIKQALQDGMDIIVICTDARDDLFWETELPKLNFGKTIVIAAAGNNGHNLGKSTFAMADSKEFITVASMVSSYNEVQEITVNDVIIDELFYFFVFPDRPFAIFKENWILMPAEETACKEFTDASLKGKVVLVSSLDCPIRTKVDNLQKSKVSGVIIYGDKRGNLKFDYNYIPTVPVAGIETSWKELKDIFSRPSPPFQQVKNFFSGSSLLFAKRNPSRLILQDKEGEISDFSSKGPAKNYDIKPDISAPGDCVATTYPLNRGKYRTVSGTSFSAPYIAGLAALFLEVNPTATPSDFSRALMNSAVPIKNKDVSNSVAVSVAKQGAGAVNAYALLMNKLSVSPHKISLGRLNQESITLPLTITNNDHLLYKVFTIGQFPSSLAINPGLKPDYLKLDFSPNLKMYPIAPGTSIKIDVTFSRKNVFQEEDDFLSGYIYLREESIKETIHVPYLGVISRF